MAFVNLVARIGFGVASIALMLLAGALIVYAFMQVGSAYRQPEANVGATLLEAVGYTIIAIAVFDVGKYLFEEEAVRGREMRQADEARRSMTKFISTIAIAVFLESLVVVFSASKTDIQAMIYPTILLFAGVALVIGLGVYQWLSAEVEKKVGGSDEQKEEESEAERQKG
jgi:putative Mn2+ efflux pump MntP